MTAAEINTTLKGFLDAKGRLTAFPAKRKKKLYALAYLAAFVEPEKRYTERAAVPAYGVPRSRHTAA